MKKSPVSDTTLAEELRQGGEGSEKAFETIYRQYHRLMYAVAFRYLASPEDAEDMVADVFVRFWEMHRTIVIETSLRNYLYTMMKNMILNRWRKSEPVFIADYSEAQQKEDDDGFEKMLEQKELLEQIHKAIDDLPEQKRRICLMKLEENLRNEEIAKRMNISPNTVKTHYMQALRQLRIVCLRILIPVAALTQIIINSVN
jgi:RNA polymerase sigma-70 factor (ECF subfamily)